MRTIIYFFLVMFIVLLYYPIFFIGWLLGLTFDKKKKLIQYTTIGFSKGLLYVNPWWRVKIEGLENFDKTKTYLILINHRSLYDIPLVNILPINMRWIAKYELYKAPILGQILFFKGDIMVKRGDPASAKSMMIKCFQTLKQGVTISMFPEGTRSKDGTLHSFKEGAFIIAKKGRVPILPIIVEGTWEAENRNKFGLLNPNTFTLNILPEIPVSVIKDMGVRDLCDYTHSMLYDKHVEMVPHLYARSEKVDENKQNSN